MLKSHRGWKVILATGLVVAVCFGMATLFTDVQAGGCRCPRVYAPVMCDGHYFVNWCYAECHGYTVADCVPLPL